MNKKNLQGNFIERWDLAEWLERLTANANVTIVLVSIPASSDTVEFEGRHMKQCGIKYKKEKKGEYGDNKKRQEKVRNEFWKWNTGSFEIFANKQKFDS